MHTLLKPAAAIVVMLGSLFTLDMSTNRDNPSVTKPANADAKIQNSITPERHPKIQVAILLDVSNSMDGLIEQAKAQLWNMVSVMGKAQCDGAAPSIEIALYEYGRPTNGIQTGYIKQINGFTSDLDQVSKNLFKLATNGGDEYCGHVMYTSLTGLNWDASAENYKVIFIAGNEDFLQGNISYTQACTAAKNKGVIVNTIYCGDRMQGIREHWNLGSECGSGSFTNINQNATIDDIATPYDNELFLLNEKLNKTYISYGAAGAANHSKQAEVDQMNTTLNKSAAAKRVAVKGNKQLYKNSTWDLVDASADDAAIIDKIDRKTLPDSLQTKSKTELQQFVKIKSLERNNIQKQIATVSSKREAFIAAEKARKTTNNSEQTLETEIEKIIKTQAKRFKMIIQ